ncbi:uncharacterized protein SPSK_05661 [Sporothrix schenckii 1099-18]|uniref:Uncharacterized protein n=1 Tax=Sporothrix schenckii 1099-18 TaxID=1397361 RepID=A0A0F2LWA6_SPOSC|nr:uncharacterized protein SPSK_05661 [Sporothrix schenckii 1099-18]KJR81114.1 hypothetical protein SPSK_05661 [Sporothrix schenckii 1099-18]
MALLPADHSSTELWLRPNHKPQKLNARTVPNAIVNHPSFFVRGISPTSNIPLNVLPPFHPVASTAHFARSDAEPHAFLFYFIRFIFWVAGEIRRVSTILDSSPLPFFTSIELSTPKA